MKKRIFIYSDSAAGSGAENVLRTIAERLAARGHAVTVSSESTTKRQFEALYAPGIRYFQQSLPYRYYRRFSLGWLRQGIQNRLYRYVVVPARMRKRYDIGIAFKEGQSMLRVSRMRCSQKIAWVHTDFSGLHWTKEVFSSNEAERECFQRFDKVVFVSETSRKSFIRIFGDLGNLYVAHNPLCVTVIREQAAVPVEESADGSPLFLSVGRLAEEKQYDLLLTVCRKLQETYRFSVWIIGDGYYRKRLEARIKDEGIISVRLLGRKINPFPYYTMADCYICCSRSESNPLSIQEALILGTPVISTWFPAITEVTEPAFGMITENSAEGLERALKEVLQHPEHFQEWRRRIEADFSSEAMWEPRIETVMRLIET